MILKLANKLVGYQLDKEIIAEKDKRLYVYGYNLFISRIVSFVLLVTIASIFNTYIEMLIFSLYFIPLRQYAGGYHFNSSEKCIVFSVVLIGAINILLGRLNYTYIMKLVLHIAMVISSVIIIYLAPVDCANKRLEELERKIYKRRTIKVLLFELVIYIGFSGLELKKYLAIMAASHTVIAISLLLGGTRKRNSFECELAGDN